MNADYPLRFQPILRRYLWGGRRLESILGKSLPEATRGRIDRMWVANNMHKTRMGKERQDALQASRV